MRRRSKWRLLNWWRDWRYAAFYAEVESWDGYESVWVDAQVAAQVRRTS